MPVAMAVFLRCRKPQVCGPDIRGGGAAADLTAVDDRWSPMRTSGSPGAVWVVRSETTGPANCPASVATWTSSSAPSQRTGRSATGAEAAGGAIEGGDVRTSTCGEGAGAEMKDQSRRRAARPSSVTSGEAVERRAIVRVRYALTGLWAREGTSRRDGGSCERLRGLYGMPTGARGPV